MSGQPEQTDSTVPDNSAAYSAVAFQDLLRRSPGLSDAAVRVGLILEGYANKSGCCWPSQSRVAADLDWSPRKTKRAFRELQDSGVIDYETRARHRGERSVIRLRSRANTVTSGTSDTGARSGREPVPNPVDTGVGSGTQNSPMNSPSEHTQFLAADESAPRGNGSCSFSARNVVDHAVALAASSGFTLVTAMASRIGQQAKQALEAGARPEHTLQTAEIIVKENRPPSDFPYIIGDLERGSNGRSGKHSYHRRTDSSEGRSVNGEYA